MHMSLFAYTDAFFGLLCIFCFQGAAVYSLLGYGSCGEVVKIIDRARHANWQAQYEDRQQQKKVQQQLEAALLCQHPALRALWRLNSKAQH